MPSTRAQQRRETVYGWADMREELLAKVLEAAGWQQGGLRFSQASATVRLVCAGWKAVHDALVRRLVLRRQTTDEAMDMLVRCFPAVVSLEFKGDTWGVLTDEGLRSVSSLASLTFFFTCCRGVTDEGLRSVSILPVLSSLDLLQQCDGRWRAGAPQHHRRP
jgi:hypothetical protein